MSVNALAIYSIYCPWWLGDGGAYCLLLPPSYLLPKALVEQKDDQVIPSEEALVAA